MRRVLTLLQAMQARFWVLDYSFDYSCNKLKFGTNARFGYSSSKHHHCATIIHIDSLTRGDLFGSSRYIEQYAIFANFFFCISGQYGVCTEL